MGCLWESKFPQLLGRTVVLTNHHAVQITMHISRLWVAMCISATGDEQGLSRTGRCKQPMCPKGGPMPPTPAHLRNLPSLHTLEVWACGETAASPVVMGMASASCWHQWACPLVLTAQAVPPRPSEVNLYNDTDDSGALELPPGFLRSLAVGPQLPCCKDTRGVP